VSKRQLLRDLLVSAASLRFLLDDQNRDERVTSWDNGLSPTCARARGIFPHGRAWCYIYGGPSRLASYCSLSRLRVGGAESASARKMFRGVCVSLGRCVIVGFGASHLAAIR